MQYITWLNVNFLSCGCVCRPIIRSDHDASAIRGTICQWFARRPSYWFGRSFGCRSRGWNVIQRKCMVVHRCATGMRSFVRHIQFILQKRFTWLRHQLSEWSEMWWFTGLTILATSLYGGALLSITMDYFLENLTMLPWIWQRISLKPVQQPPCWFSWLVLGFWLFFTATGVLVQACVTGRGQHHEDGKYCTHQQNFNWFMLL